MATKVKTTAAQDEFPCTDDELLAAMHGYEQTRAVLDDAQHVHTLARVRLVAALKSRGITSLLS